MWTGHGTPTDTMWGIPRGMSPMMYQSQMQPYMQRMNSQMAAIAKETDPRKRQALMRKYYATIYRDMQSMRGMVWMWTPMPPPRCRTRIRMAHSSWRVFARNAMPRRRPRSTRQPNGQRVTSRMRQHTQQTQAAGGGVKAPSAAELDEITKYLTKHAAAPR